MNNIIKLTFLNNEKTFEINLKWTNNKNMYLRVNKKNEIFVTAPKHLKMETIKSFVEKNLNNIEKYLQKNINNQFSIFKEKQVKIFNENFYILFSDQIEDFIIKNKIIFLNIKYNDEKKFENKMHLILNKKLNEYLTTKTLIFEKELKMKEHKIKIRNKNTSWGTNYLKKQTIIFSSKLVHFSFNVIDYVILHELIHDFFPNHSKNFWNKIYEICPNYKMIKKELK